MATTMGMSTSSSRVNVKPKTSEPPSSKVTANTAHGASMALPAGNRPDGWATFGHGAQSGANAHRADDWGKSGQKQARPSLSFAPGRTKGTKL